MSSSPHVIDVDAASFQAEVVERSREVPVVVDFWAGWCTPCRTLGPMLEQAIDARGGEIRLAKVDVEAEQSLAQTYQVRGIPHVLGFRDGEVVSEFTGAIPAAELATFLTELRPREIDLAIERARAASGPEAIEALRRVLELEPGHRAAALALADRLVEVDADEAAALIQPYLPQPEAERIAVRIELLRGAGDLGALRDAVGQGATDPETLVEYGRALAAHGHHDEAIEQLLEAVRIGGDTREPARAQLVALFTLLGDDDELVRAARPRLARALY